MMGDKILGLMNETKYVVRQICVDVQWTGIEIRKWTHVTRNPHYTDKYTVSRSRHQH